MYMCVLPYLIIHNRVWYIHKIRGENMSEKLENILSGTIALIFAIGIIY